jgi:hypothetical protein
MLRRDFAPEMSGVLYAARHMGQSRFAELTGASGPIACGTSLAPMRWRSRYPESIFPSSQADGRLTKSIAALAWLGEVLGRGKSGPAVAVLENDGL